MIKNHHVNLQTNYSPFDIEGGAADDAPKASNNSL
jgi:hypothetical protein